LRVRVPASIANLGPGFDILAMAVDLWLEVEAEPAAVPSWSFSGEGADFLGQHPNPLSVLPMRGEVRCGIPLGVGLGSSAAARLAAAVLSADPDPLGAATKAEGHPDNVAAAFRGGLVMSVGGALLDLPRPDLEIALLVAFDPVPTERARSVLPPAIPHATAVLNAGRLALLVEVFHSRRWDLLGAASEDSLHQPFRESLYPWVARVRAAALEAGALASAVCGAGPSVFAYCRQGEASGVAQSMEHASGGRGRALVTQVSSSGLVVEA